MITSRKWPRKFKIVEIDRKKEANQYFHILLYIILGFLFHFEMKIFTKIEAWNCIVHLFPCSFLNR